MPDEARKCMEKKEGVVYPLLVHRDEAETHLRRMLAENEELRGYKQEVEEVAELMYQHTMKRLIEGDNDEAE